MQYTDESVDSTSKVLVSIMMSVSSSNKGKSFEVETLRHQQSILSRNNGETHSRPTSAEDRQKCYEDKVGRWIEIWNSRCFPLLAAWLCESDLWRVRRLSKRQTQRRIVPQSKSRCENGNGDNFECLLDDDGLKHIDTLLKSKDAVNDMVNTWIQRFKLEQSCVVELWIQSWIGFNWTI